LTSSIESIDKMDCILLDLSILAIKPRIAFRYGVWDHNQNVLGRLHNEHIENIWTG